MYRKMRSPYFRLIEEFRADLVSWAIPNAFHWHSTKYMLYKCLRYTWCLLRGHAYESSAMEYLDLAANSAHKEIYLKYAIQQRNFERCKKCDEWRKKC
jgi:hypothetical protein